MKIYSINTYENIRQNSLTNKKITKPNLNYNPSFGYFGNYGNADSLFGEMGRYTYFNPDKLDILNKTNEQLIKLAEHFHKFTDKELKDVAVKKSGIFSGTTFDENVYTRLKNAVSFVQNKKLASVKRIKVLEEKKNLYLQDFSEGKSVIHNEFLKFTNFEKMGIDVPVPSGILFYGNGDKLSMNKWLLSKPGFRIEYFNHNQNNPMSTLSKIMEEARIAPKIFDNTKQRTILSIENLDDMLIEPDNINDVKLIGRFKNIMEDLADNNKHLTVATIINKPIDELEQAAVAPHRFGVQLEMKSFISKKELDELKNLNDYIELLEKKSDDDLINRLYTDKRFQFVADQEGTR